MRPPTYRCRGCGALLGILPRRWCRACADVRPDDHRLSAHREGDDR
jgi:hypothetical protein